MPSEEQIEKAANALTYHVLTPLAGSELYREAAKAALSASEGVKPRVKPLEWRSDAWARDFERADSPLGLYKVTLFPNMDQPWALVTPNYPGEKYFDDYQSAKAAAQADYEARIRSALEHP